MSYNDKIELTQLDETPDTTVVGSTGQGTTAHVVKTKTVGTYPTTAGSYFAVERNWITGDEVEGGTGTLTGQSDTLYALNLGASVPASGTPVIISFVDYRWVFRYG